MKSARLIWAAKEGTGAEQTAFSAPVSITVSQLQDLAIVIMLVLCSALGDFCKVWIFEYAEIVNKWFLSSLLPF